MNSKKIVRIKTMTNMGDLIASMAGIKSYCEENDCKAIIFQFLNVENTYYKGAVHPIVNEEGAQVCMNISTFNFIKPLIIEQSYIEDFLIWEGQQIDFDFDIIRTSVTDFANIPHGAIQNWNGLYFDEFQADISKQWVNVDMYENDFLSKYPNIKNKVIINFTSRYRSHFLGYFFLKEYQKDLLFIGLPQEAEIFNFKWKLSIGYELFENALEIAQALKHCKFFLGNQSFVYNLAESMKIPRIVELSRAFQNCIHGIGNHSYGHFLQHGIEGRFKKLFELL